MINQVWLNTFCTLVEIGNFTKTAETLFMTQSGVSQQVKKLEQYLGVSLLVREGKRIIVTDKGTELYQEGKRILQEMSQLHNSIRTDREDSGPVRIQSTGSLGLKLYPFCLDIQQAKPGLAFTYRFAPNPDIEQSLREQKADIGLMTRIPHANDLTFSQISQEPLLLVVPSLLASAELMNLQQLGFINHPDGMYQAQLLFNDNLPGYKDMQGFRVSGFSNQIHLILEPVARGLGFTVLPQYAVDAFNEPEKIKTIQLPNQVCEPVYLVKSNKSAQPKRITLIEQQITAFLNHSATISPDG